MINNEKPFFSVIVPVYNKEPHITRSINSILNQTFTGFELLIVCDPSTDNSNKEVAKFDDPRIRVFYRDEPGPGGYAARNLGIKEAKAEWIAFLDADDEWYPEHLEKIKELISYYPEARYITSVRLAEQNGKLEKDSYSKSVFEDRKLISFKEYLQLCIINRRPVNTNSATIHKSWTETNQWFPEGRSSRSGDLYLWVKIASEVRSIAWSSHIGSVSYRDVVGVSKNSVPSIKLNHDMVKELKHNCSTSEYDYLKKLANRMIRTAWFEQRKMLNKTETALFKSFYWKNDLRFCLFWTTLSLFPNSLFILLVKIKNWIRRN